MEDVIEHLDGSATYCGYRYARKQYAYLVRARSIKSHTRDEWIKLCEQYNFRCCKCGSEVIGGIPTKDHIIPPILGGSDGIDNLQPLCRECNTAKGRNIIDYRHG